MTTCPCGIDAREYHRERPRRPTMTVDLCGTNEDCTVIHCSACGATIHYMQGAEVHIPTNISGHVCGPPGKATWGEATSKSSLLDELKADGGVRMLGFLRALDRMARAASGVPIDDIPPRSDQ